MLPVNENAPTFSAPLPANQNIPENVASGALIQDLTADDTDTDDASSDDGKITFGFVTVKARKCNSHFVCKLHCLV